ncbi:hypothetical protein ACFUIZ_33635 [Streptomyces cinereoruber]|uniref:hypothetical protein n=1 Tax=Streptomyces cinereoruber TaxID=67260 RepID=UPI00363C0D4E
MSLAAALLGLASAGCGGSDERAAGASAVATGFERALEQGDLKAACAALAPDTRSELEESEKKACHVGIVAEELPVGGPVGAVDVYGRQARVVLKADTLFLSQFPDGWKVVAAGCVPDPGRPYRCAVKGG